MIFALITHISLVEECECVKRPVTLYLDSDQYELLKKTCIATGVSVSTKVDELIRHSIAETTGEKGEAVNPVDYEDLKRRHIKMVAELDKLYKRLEKTKRSDDMVEFAQKLGLDTKNFTNLTELAPTMLEKWHAQGGLKEHMHLFIAYLELLRDKRQLEASLEETRRKMAQEAEPSQPHIKKNKPRLSPEFVALYKRWKMKKTRGDKEEAEEPEKPEPEPEDEEPSDEESEDEEEDDLTWQQRPSNPIVIPWPSTVEQDEEQDEEDGEDFEEPEDYEDFYEEGEEV